MPNFTANNLDGCTIWEPIPTQEAAYQSLLESLTEIVGDAFLSTGSTLSQSQFGNMGEYISFFVGKDAIAPLTGCHCIASNALNPLNTISVSGVDLIWVHFGNTESEDSLFIQEVKTSSQPDPTTATGLLDDYQKLFGADQRVSLKSRISCLKAKLKYEWSEPTLAKRCSKFIGVEPSECAQVSVFPTLVFDKTSSNYGTATGRLIQVQSTLIGYGWNPDRIEMVGIGLDNLRESLTNLACGIS